MGTGNHGGFGKTLGSKRSPSFPMNLQFFASKAFEKGGHISEESFEGHREFFLGKSAKRLQKEMEKQGYQTHIERSTHPKSKAKKIVVENKSKEKNISNIQVSPGSKRHGETPYVKVSTTNAGKFKVVSDESKYKSDGKEKAKIYFARRKKK